MTKALAIILNLYEYTENSLYWHKVLIFWISAMDKVSNPFSPGAGAQPPELAGRQPILEKARIMFERLKAGRSEKSFLLIGLRGVGKTVLLNQIDSLSEKSGYKSIYIEAHEKKSLAALLLPPLRQLLFQLDRMENISQKIIKRLPSSKKLYE